MQYQELYEGYERINCMDFYEDSSMFQYDTESQCSQNMLFPHKREFHKKSPSLLSYNTNPNEDIVIEDTPVNHLANDVQNTKERFQGARSVNQSVKYFQFSEKYPKHTTLQLGQGVGKDFKGKIEGISSKELKQRRRYMLLENDYVQESFSCINISQCDVLFSSLNMFAGISVLFTQHYIMFYLDMYLCFNLFVKAGNTELFFAKFSIFGAYVLAISIQLLKLKNRQCAQNICRRVNLSLIFEIAVFTSFAFLPKLENNYNLLPQNYAFVYQVLLMASARYVLSNLDDTLDSFQRQQVVKSDFFHQEKAQLESQKLILNVRSFAMVIAAVSVGILFNQSKEPVNEQVYLNLILLLSASFTTFNFLTK
ncbi:UNKNOWN [Stylonychia lemnae]|uniref:Transmembrane protein n=1 Tax=Stylonychia lemnae TaxID=5949 RepID=A0A078B732_STYLE|nr:UNKNOWN [Stylonychia lemnae]|eukprot:CDW90325.1 UNKNOWN [Stylonychia lemnae]